MNTSGLALQESFDAERFLDQCFGRRPCLIRGWLQPDALALDRLLELAEQQELGTRLVSGSLSADAWSVMHGALAEDLPESDRDWTVLVQDVDKADQGVATLLEHFRFLPNWLIDDIMVSQAVAGGSVGPHRDAYDVFLVQVAGQRRWELAMDPTLLLDPRFDLALIADWQPDLSIETGPGDVLYLPPGVGHHGVALGNCQTWSVGLRTPSGPELLFGLAERGLDQAGLQTRLNPRLFDSQDPDRIGPELIEHSRALLERCLELDDQALASYLGTFLTRWRQWPAEDLPEVEKIRQHLLAGLPVALHESARLALLPDPGGAHLVVNGERLPCPAELASRLSRTRRLDGDWLEHPEALAALIDCGAVARPLPPHLVKRP